MSEILESADGECLFGITEELCLAGIVVEDVEGGETGDDGDDALEDEDPAPALQAAGPVHLVDEAGKQSSECTGATDGTEEEAEPGCDLPPGVPLLQVDWRSSQFRQVLCFPALRRGDSQVAAGRKPASVAPRKRRTMINPE